jgi:hypothetical protein
MSDRTELPERGERARTPPGGGALDLDRIRAAIDGVRFGEVRVIIQDSVIVQIERVERQRLR